jgi:hypothetical protein
MRTDDLDATTDDIQWKSDSRATGWFPGIQWQISVMPNIVADQQCSDTGRQWEVSFLSFRAAPIAA